MTKSDFAALYDAHVSIVRSILYRMCPREKLDDLTQEVFLRAWRGQAQFRGESSTKTWICRIARNIAIDALRAGRNDHLRTDESALDTVAEKGMDQSERMIVQEVLAQMSPDDRLLLLLLTVEECSLAEVSDILEIPVGTVKSRSFAARGRFVERLDATSKGAA